ncbi:N1R/p28-like protein [Choristoneura biennis entomopoxvirus]|uniref:N1R/p28-like protein n=1 Tax=Choristoneura biennis entomopoxvirus TaxID=10288 RepID=A0A916KPG6_CBEPV|nr:anti-repressor Ant [Choristoneura biennis entomopoxvirus]CCU55668.1 N1R/p28-like protein [Choristoneura biennis entomopoxvirus]
MDNMLIKTDLNGTLKCNSMSTLSNDFIKNFNEIFKYNNKSINVVGNIDNPWFCGKDVLEILEYDISSFKKRLQKLKESYKKSYGRLLEELGVVATPNLKYHDSKIIYVNEAGLYSLIMNSKLESAKSFQEYVLEVLLPSIRKIAQKNYLDIINNKQDSINDLSIKIDNISIQNNELISKTSEQSIEILKLNKQNQLALNKLQELGINLIETKEELTSKIDKIIVDRNIKPKDTKRQHKYLLLKNKSNNNEFKFIRAQDQYIKTNKSIWLEKYNIIIEEKYNPNPIDLCVRLKNKIIEMDKTRINNLKNKDKYKQDKKALKDKIDNREPFIEIKGNNFILNRCDEDKFINVVKSIENEQYNI